MKTGKMSLHSINGLPKIKKPGLGIIDSSDFPSVKPLSESLLLRTNVDHSGLKAVATAWRIFFWNKSKQETSEL